MGKDDKPQYDPSRAESLLDELIGEMGLDSKGERQEGDTSSGAPTTDPDAAPNTKTAGSEDVGHRNSVELDMDAVKGVLFGPSGDAQGGLGAGPSNGPQPDDLDLDPDDDEEVFGKKRDKVSLFLFTVVAVVVVGFGTVIGVFYAKDPERFKATCEGRIVELRDKRAKEEQAKATAEAMRRRTKYGTIKLDITPGAIKVSVKDNGQPLSGPAAEELGKINRQFAANREASKATFELKNLRIMEYSKEKKKHIIHEYELTIERRGYVARRLVLMRYKWKKVGPIDSAFTQGIDLDPLPPPPPAKEDTDTKKEG